MAPVTIAVVATTAHQRWVMNVPTRTRNSPTNPLSPGRPTALITTARKTAARIGADFWRPPSSADLGGAPPLPDHADEEEQGAGGQAVVDHLEHAAGDPLGAEGEEAEHDEGHVDDRRVGDQPLEVLLHDRDDGAVDDADRGQGEQGRGQVDGAPGKHEEAEAQQPVGAELEEDAGQDHRPGGRRLGVGVGQPAVERDQRDLDREGHGDTAEDQGLVGVGQARWPAG